MWSLMKQDSDKSSDATAKISLLVHITLSVCLQADKPESVLCRLLEPSRQVTYGSVSDTAIILMIDLSESFTERNCTVC